MAEGKQNGNVLGNAEQTWASMRARSFSCIKSKVLVNDKEDFKGARYERIPPSIKQLPKTTVQPQRASDSMSVIWITHHHHPELVSDVAVSTSVSQAVLF